MVLYRRLELRLAENAHAGSLDVESRSACLDLGHQSRASRRTLEAVRLVRWKRRSTQLISGYSCSQLHDLA
jgi:hypothetical protein